MNTDLIYLLKRNQFAHGLQSVQAYMETLEDVRKHYTMRPFYNPIQYKNNSRYKNVKTLKDEDTGRIFHENITKQYISKTNQDEYVTVDLTTENRLDIISNTVYGTPRYWWVLALANSIIDPFDVPRGTSLRVPPIVSLYNIGGVLSG